MKNFYNEFKTQIVTVFLIFFAFSAFITIFGPIPFNINSINTTKTDLFSSSGAGEVTDVPDEATVYLGVTKSALTVKEAQDQTNIVINKLISDLKKNGIDKRKTKTTNYSVNPSYNNNGIEPVAIEGAKQNGFEVTQNLEIKISPIEKVNTIIDLATKNGANLVGGTSFNFSETMQRSLEEKATELAVKEAKEKAQILARSAGVNLGKIVNVVSSTNNPRPVMMMNAVVKGEGDTQTNITPGENKVTIGVTIYYETR